jgi:hypothetical protein
MKPTETQKKLNKINSTILNTSNEYKIQIFEELNNIDHLLEGINIDMPVIKSTRNNKLLTDVFGDFIFEYREVENGQCLYIVDPIAYSTARNTLNHSIDHPIYKKK